MKSILAIIGSASENSSNQKLIEYLADFTKSDLEWNIFTDLKSLPHFDPGLSIQNTPQEIINFRKQIEQADGIIICTPEYVFSIPSGLKNAIEWCVSTTVFSDKSTGLITASAQGEKGHEELQLIMKTLTSKFTNKTTLLISGIKSKISESGQVTDSKTQFELEQFIKSFQTLLSRND
jgi:chromate reductase